MLDKYQPKIIEALNNNKIMGANILIKREDKVILNLSHGYASYFNNEITNKIINEKDLSNYYDICKFVFNLNITERNKLPAPIRMLNNHIFDIASLTKVFSTTILIMMLLEEGKINLDDSLEQFFPNIFNNDKKNITIEMLLRHKSGLVEWMPLYCLLENKGQILEYIAQQDLAYTKNYDRHYSDIGFILLSLIIEQIYSKSLRDVFKEKISDPLSLKNTSYGTNNLNKSLIVTGSFGNPFEYNMIKNNKFGFCKNYNPDHFLNWRKYFLKGEVNDGNCYHILKGVSGHAGLFSNIEELDKISQIFSNKGVIEGKKIIDKKIIDLFIKPKSGYSLGFAYGQHLGIGNLDENEEIIGHHGFAGTSYFYLPKKNISAIILTNRQHIGIDDKGYYPSLEVVRTTVYNIMKDLQK